ncbi:UNKNOWN [Stylonychia lemnae]|uniref:Uncharacterized protein n=1 Tax=Stylonychia lemnae TaxID=5949 RepID=A0A078B4P9_STYLE|nr:UNKNOWN [Stylonychia lemnae]|eukprot:CDW89510.1 UNKNOWN [Stylonychia lemnae]
MLSVTVRATQSDLIEDSQDFENQNVETQQEFSQEEQSAPTTTELPKRQLPPLCKEELPTLSVKDVLLTSANWDSFKKKNELFILGVSDSECPLCCQSEPLLKELQDLFQNNKYLYKGKKIQIARIDTSKKNQFLEKEEITFENVPKVIIIKDQRFYGFDQPLDRMDLLLHQINRILNPLITLKTEEEIELFLDHEKFWDADYQTKFFKNNQDVVPRMENHYSQLRYKTRVICFIYDKQEYREEYKNLKSDAKYLATRDNLRIGFVDNQRLIKKMKAKYSVRMFSSIAMSSLVMKRYDGELLNYDLTSEDHIFIHNWINKHTLKEVDELNNESYRIYELLRQPMFLTFVDFEDQRYSKACYKAVEVMRQVAPKFSHIMGFLYVNNTQFYLRKRVLGVTWDELPSMAFNMIDNRVIPYPRGKPIERDILFDWFDDIVKGKVSVKTTGFDRIVNDTDIQTYLLNNTIVANRENFYEIAFSEGFDVVVLFYTTEVVHNVQRNIALQFNLVADAFIKLQMQDYIKVVSYDINVNAFPEGIEFTTDLPQIYFFPAYHKKAPFKKYIGQGIAGSILTYIQKHADTEFQYPVDVSKIGMPREKNEQEENQNQQQSQETQENQQNQEDQIIDLDKENNSESMNKEEIDQSIEENSAQQQEQLENLQEESIHEDL